MRVSACRAPDTLKRDAAVPKSIILEKWTESRRRASKKSGEKLCVKDYGCVSVARGEDSLKIAIFDTGTGETLPVDHALRE